MQSLGAFLSNLCMCDIIQGTTHKQVNITNMNTNTNRALQTVDEDTNQIRSPQLIDSR